MCLSVVTEITEEAPTEVVTVEVTPQPTEEAPERETVEVTFAPKPTEEALKPETTEITFAPKPKEEVPERETVEVTFAPKPTEEAPKPETTEITFAPKQKEEVPERETAEVTFAPKPTEEAPKEVVEVEFKPAPKPTALWEAPEDFEIVIERFEEVEEVPVEEVPDVTTTEVTLEKAPTPAAKVEFKIKPEVSEEVTTEVTTVVKKEGTVVHEVSLDHIDLQIYSCMTYLHHDPSCMCVECLELLHLHTNPFLCLQPMFPICMYTFISILI